MLLSGDWQQRPWRGISARVSRLLVTRNPQGLRRGTYIERERDEGTGGHIVFLPDNRRVAIGRFMQPTVDIYERATGKRIRSASDRFEGEHFGVCALGISPDGDAVAAATNQRLMLWDALGDE